MLREEFLVPLGLTQADLARRLKKTTTAINELVRGKRGISAEMAWLLSEELDTTPDVWMNLQMSWDLWHARRTLRRAGRLAR